MSIQAPINRKNKAPQPEVYHTISRVSSNGYLRNVYVRVGLDWETDYPEFVSFDAVVWC